MFQWLSGQLGVVVVQQSKALVIDYEIGMRSALAELTNQLARQ
jgi:hypothetical protein